MTPRSARAAATTVAAAAMTLAFATLARPALGPRYGGEVRIALPDLTGDGSPGVPRGRGERILAGLVHETLLGIDEEGRPRPALAQSWASAADGREWTLRLAPASFHDGTDVTSADAVRAIRRFLRSGSTAAGHLARTMEGGDEFARAVTEALPAVAAADATRLVLRLRDPAALPLAALSSPAAAVVSSRGAGAGPFAPTTPPSARGVSAIAFGRHVRGRPFLDVVRLVPAAAEGRPEPTADVALTAAPLPPADGLLLLILDARAGPLADARVRALVAASVDRATLARHFLAGGEPADTLLTPGLLPPLPPTAASAASGPATGRLTLRVAPDVPASASRRVVAHLTALGLEVQALPAAAGAAPSPPAPGQARLLVWYPEVAEAGLALEELAALAGGPPEIRGLVQVADALRDSDRRRAELQRAEEALRAEHVLVPLARLPLGLAARPGVHGARTTATGALLLEDAWVEP